MALKCIDTFRHNIKKNITIPLTWLSCKESSYFPLCLITDKLLSDTTEISRRILEMQSPLKNEAKIPCKISVWIFLTQVPTLRLYLLHLSEGLFLEHSVQQSKEILTQSSEALIVMPKFQYITNIRMLLLS